MVVAVYTVTQLILMFFLPPKVQKLIIATWQLSLPSPYCGKSWQHFSHYSFFLPLPSLTLSVRIALKTWTSWTSPAPSPCFLSACLPFTLLLSIHVCQAITTSIPPLHWFSPLLQFISFLIHPLILHIHPPLPRYTSFSWLFPPFICLCWCRLCVYTILFHPFPSFLFSSLLLASIFFYSHQFSHP